MGPSHAPLLPHSRGSGSSSARRGSVAARAFTATAAVAPATATGFSAIWASWASWFPLWAPSWAPFAVVYILGKAALELFKNVRKTSLNSTAPDGGGDAAAGAYTR